MARIAVIIGEGFEDSEYFEPAKAFRDAGHKLTHIGTEQQEVKGKSGKTKVRIDMPSGKADPGDFDALFIPGGHSPDHIRTDERIVAFAKAMLDAGKPVLAICHGPQVLISGDAVRGRAMTAWKTVQQDLRFAGAIVRDEKVVIDHNLVTSREPDDIPFFVDASLERLAQGHEHARGVVGSPA